MADNVVLVLSPSILLALASSPTSRSLDLVSLAMVAPLALETQDPSLMRSPMLSLRGSWDNT
jgi:hypothetical protein